MSAYRVCMTEGYAGAGNAWYTVEALVYGRVGIVAARFKGGGYMQLDGKLRSNQRTRAKTLRSVVKVRIGGRRG